MAPDREEPGPGTGPKRVLAATLALAVGLLAAEAAAAKTRFVPLPGVEIPESRLFDLGATDYDGDGNLDVFTTNHKFHPALLHNDGDGVFSDRTASAGLSPTPQFPGLEFLRAPPMGSPGIYVYITDSDVEKLPGVLHIRSTESEATGRVIFEGEPIAVRRSERVSFDGTRNAAGQTTLDFEIQPGGVLDILENPIDFPISVRIDPPPPPPLPLPIIPQPEAPTVYVGTRAVMATSEQFLLTLRDRHGYVFADVGGGTGADLFAVSGGLGGKIALPGYEGRVQDELLLDSSGEFAAGAPGSGLDKGTCRARQAAAIDVDSDGLLDLFESCEGARPRVFRQLARAGFAQLAPPKAIASSFRWTQLNGAATRPELLAATAGGVRVLELGPRGWRERQTIRDHARNGQVDQFATADFDSDGDLDVLAVSGSGNTMLRNDGGRLRRLPLARLGLPEESVAASFVDFDNDGRLDLDLVPQGLLRNAGGGDYRETGLLRTKRAGAGLTTWPDLDNDGTREALIATGNATFSKRKRAAAFSSRGRSGHWLEVDLVGAPGNLQAIGAEVTAGSGAAAQHQWVGQNDDSHFSQGHYRTYFGLGKRPAVSRLVVEWPDGTTTRIADVAADQVLRVVHP